MKTIRVLAVLLAASSLAACTRRAEDASIPPPDPAAPAPQELEARQLRAQGYLGAAESADSARRDMSTPATATPVAQRTAQSGTDALDSVWAQQKLIRDGRIEAEVESVDAAVERIGEVAGAGQALIAGSEIRKGPAGRKTGTVTLKVPAGSFDDLLNALRELGKVRSESTSTQDVTKAYTDLETRLAVKRRTQERLETLLESRTGSLSDLLQVERELERVVTEIERMLGEKRYYDQRIAVSTITIVLFEPGVPLHPNYFEPVRDALKDALRVFAASVAALVFVTTGAIPWLLLAWLLWVLVRRARRRKAARSNE